MAVSTTSGLAEMAARARARGSMVVRTVAAPRLRGIRLRDGPDRYPGIADSRAERT